jgi:hypothetical protein
MECSAFFDCEVAGYDPGAIERIALAMNRGGRIDALVRDGRIELRSSSLPASALRLTWKTALANERSAADGAPFRAGMLALLIE